MEVQARYALIGAFTAAAIVAVFSFVYWLENKGGLGDQSIYDVRFEQSISGLLVGSGVTFNGIRVGEVASLKLNSENPKQVLAQISVNATTPVRTDTKVGVDYNGLTGTAVIALKGGSAQAAQAKGEDGKPPLLIADPAAGLSWTEGARQVLSRMNSILEENAKPLNNVMTNLDTFSEVLGKNSDRIGGILAGLERMTGGAKGKAKTIVFDLKAPEDFPPLTRTSTWQVSVPEPTTVLAFNTDKILTEPREGESATLEGGQWSDNLPNLFQEKVIQSFENAGFMEQAGRRQAGFETEYELLIDIRSFTLSTSAAPVAKMQFIAKLLGENGKIAAAKSFSATAPANGTDARAAAAALNSAFAKSAKELVLWASGAI